MRSSLPRQLSCAILFGTMVAPAAPCTAAAEHSAPPSAINDASNGSKQAVLKGLTWLAARQNEHGQFIEDRTGPSDDIAFTALSGLAFLSADSGQANDEFATHVRAAIKAVLASQQPTGLFAEKATPGPMYGHGYATLFLAEAQRKHPDGAIRKALEKSVALLEKSASKEGGWRYRPEPLDADVSVTACELNALLAARAAGIGVNDALIDKAVQFVRRCQNPDGGFAYMALPGSGSGLPRSAAGLAVLLHSGATPAADTGVQRAMNYVTRALGANSMTHYFYGRYYASQWLATDPAAQTQWDAVTKELLDAQQPNGSWKDEIGPVYATANALIVLQAPRKQLWIFGASQ